MMSMLQTMMMENRNSASDTRASLASMERKFTGAKEETKSMISAANVELQKAMDLQLGVQLKAAADKAESVNRTILNRLASLEKSRNEDSVSTVSGSVRSAGSGNTAASSFYNGSNHAVRAPPPAVTPWSTYVPASGPTVARDASEKYQSPSTKGMAFPPQRGGYWGNPQGNDFNPNRVWFMGWRRELSATLLKKFARDVVDNCCPLAVSSLVSYDAGNVSKVCSMRFPDVESAKTFVEIAATKDLKWFDKSENCFVQINTKAERSLAHRAGFKFLGELRNKLTLAIGDEKKATTEISSNGPKGGVFFSDADETLQICQVIEANGAFDVQWFESSLEKYGLAAAAPGIRESAINVIQTFTANVGSSRPFSR